MLETEVGSEHMSTMHPHGSKQADRSVRTGPLQLSWGQGCAETVWRLA